MLLGHVTQGKLVVDDKDFGNVADYKEIYNNSLAEKLMKQILDQFLEFKAEHFARLFLYPCETSETIFIRQSQAIYTIKKRQPHFVPKFAMK